MNSQDNIPTRRSPKRELQLQGPRPTPLRINKDSHKIKKPPVAPPPAQPQAPPRLPVIIYTVSPKVIHTTPSDFMSLVQRLTGSSSSSSSSSSSDKVATDPLTGDKGHIPVSPAARYAAIEMARTTQSIKHNPSENSGDVGGVEIVGHERPNMFHGILSPGPASLSPIPSNFFSPPSNDPNNMVSFFNDLSPVLHGNRNFMEGAFFMPSPSNFVSPHRMPSIDLFNVFSD
ncbi:nuclear speckle RNA-binding protein B [Cajanus cajan]|uniref:Protein MKS1 n=1 Tax=Cajanus cajan TaxID=3821 RepID=A0A151R6L2_CAJCA|nr:nuclear speckle RNA-binding protein B [Cajanus cajan]KYP38202.1 Protein MKS1 [Cajanus cajan]